MTALDWLIIGAISTATLIALCWVAYGAWNADPGEPDRFGWDGEHR